MSQLVKTHYEKLLAGFAAALVAGSAAWIWTLQPELLRLRQAGAVAPGGDYTAASVAHPLAASAAWPKPAAQSHGGGWLYEVFTPPVIYYNSLAKSFAVTPPLGQVPAEGGTAFGLELLNVNFEPYRLQLAGYFGGPGDYLAAFVSPGQPETLLARTGRHFEQLGLTLRSFEVKKIVVAHDDAWPVYDVAGLAVLSDERTGQEVVLDSRARKLTDTPQATLRFLTGGEARVLHEGDSFSDDTATYRIESIQVDPPEVVVAKQTPGLPLPETRVLKPAAREGGIAGQRAAPGKFPAPPKTGLATNRH